MEWKTVESDVLIIGGGPAGCMAAINASNQNINVVLVDKSGFGRSGACGMGIDHYRIYFPEEEIKMPHTMEEQVLEETRKADGLWDPRIEFYKRVTNL